MFGELGTLQIENDRVQCHICGKWFIALGQHVYKKHNISCDEYRKIYGLNKTSVLCSTVFSEIQRSGQTGRLSQYWGSAPSAFLGSIRGKSYQTRLQGWKNRAAMNRRPEKLKRQSEQFLAGTHPAQSPSAIIKNRKAHQTPEYKKYQQQRAQVVLLRQDVREKALERSRTPEARAKRSASMRRTLAAKRASSTGI